jgi:geranylgeranyl pyrophosphate synthase
MSEPEAIALLREARGKTDRQLEEIAGSLQAQVGGLLGGALAYALGTAGKRVRPALVLACHRAVGGTGAGIVRLATAVEIIHTYSLVHDDLPCMDDDAQRRGRPTTHVAFDVATATRVGYLLVPVAVEALCQAARELSLDLVTHRAIARELLRASGIQGMVGGQWMDLQAERRSLGVDDLRGIHARKTGALIRAGCVVGALAGGATGPTLQALSDFGREIGLAFQIADDVLDATGTTAQLGKTAGRDVWLEKATYVSVLGVDAARAEAVRLAARAVGRLEAGGIRSPSLVSLAHYIVTRPS